MILEEIRGVDELYDGLIILLGLECRELISQIPYSTLFDPTHNSESWTDSSCCSYVWVSAACEVGYRDRAGCVLLQSAQVHTGLAWADQQKLSDIISD